MTEVFLTGIGLLAVLATWKWVWMPTALDATRDTLFDLRDKVLREHFMSREISLDHPIYAELRALLNGHLRHTESVSFGEFLYYSSALKGDQEIYAKTIQSAERRLLTTDPELRALIDEVRQRSAEAMIIYMVESSFSMMILAVLTLPIFIVKHLSKDSVFKSKLGLKTKNFMEQAALVG